MRTYTLISNSALRLDKFQSHVHAFWLEQRIDLRLLRAQMDLFSIRINTCYLYYVRQTWPRVYALESTDKRTYAGTNYAFAPESSRTNG